jgi:hypothetical protein
LGHVTFSVTSVQDSFKKFCNLFIGYFLNLYKLLSSKILEFKFQANLQNIVKPEMKTPKFGT